MSLPDANRNFISRHGQPAMLASPPNKNCPLPPPVNMMLLQLLCLMEDTSCASAEGLAGAAHAVERNVQEFRCAATIPTHQQIDMNAEGPPWPAAENSGNDAIACLFQVFAETKMHEFVIHKDSCASRAELHAGQTPKDKFWSVVYWLYNYGHVRDWFHQQNEFADVISRVSGINPDEVRQKCNDKYV